MSSSSQSGFSNGSGTSKASTASSAFGSTTSSNVKLVKAKLSSALKRKPQKRKRALHCRKHRRMMRLKTVGVVRSVKTVTPNIRHLMRIFGHFGVFHQRVIFLDAIFLLFVVLHENALRLMQMTDFGASNCENSYFNLKNVPNPKVGLAEIGITSQAIADVNSAGKICAFPILSALLHSCARQKVIHVTSLITVFCYAVMFCFNGSFVTRSCVFTISCNAMITRVMVWMHLVECTLSRHRVFAMAVFAMVISMADVVFFYYSFTLYDIPAFIGTTCLAQLLFTVACMRYLPPSIRQLIYWKRDDLLQQVIARYAPPFESSILSSRVMDALAYRGPITMSAFEPSLLILRSPTFCFKLAVIFVSFLHAQYFDQVIDRFGLELPVYSFYEMIPISNGGCVIGGLIIAFSVQSFRRRRMGYACLAMSLLINTLMCMIDVQKFDPTFCSDMPAESDDLRVVTLVVLAKITSMMSCLFFALILAEHFTVSTIGVLYPLVLLACRLAIDISYDAKYWKQNMRVSYALGVISLVLWPFVDDSCGGAISQNAVPCYKISTPTSKTENAEAETTQTAISASGSEITANPSAAGATDSNGPSNKS